MSLCEQRMTDADCGLWLPGLLHPGDLLVEVNGSPVVGLDPEQVIQILVGHQPPNAPSQTSGFFSES